MSELSRFNIIYIQRNSYLFSKGWYFKYHIIHSSLKPFCLSPTTYHKKEQVEAVNTRIRPGRGNPPTKETPMITTQEGEGGSGSHTNSTRDLSGNTTKQCRNYEVQTTEQEQEKTLKTLFTWKTQLQHNLSTPAQQKTRGGGQTDPQITSWWERPTKERSNKKKNQRHTQSQHKTQPKISKTGRSRRLYH